PDDVVGFEKFIERGRAIWDLAGEFFLTQSPEQILKSSDRKLIDGLRMATIPFRIGMFRKFASVVDRHVKHPRLREILYQYATYSGASPFLAPSTLNVIPFCELHFGGWSVRGGMYQIALSLERVATKLRVNIRLSTTASQILLNDPS
ncbi:hypothetical protein D7X55_41090, partial [Corallococcus sp. AB049A]